MLFRHLQLDSHAIFLTCVGNVIAISRVHAVVPLVQVAVPNGFVT